MRNSNLKIFIFILLVYNKLFYFIYYKLKFENSLQFGQIFNNNELKYLVRYNTLITLKSVLNFPHS